MPIHQWRMNAGEMTLDQDGNISLKFTTYNGTTVTATALYDFSVVSSTEDVTTTTNVQKIMRDGQVLVQRQGKWYNILGYQVH